MKNDRQLGSQKVVITYWIQTGDLCAQYTLHRSREDGRPHSPYFKPTTYIQNLGNDKTRALKKAQEWVRNERNRNEPNLVVIDSTDTGFNLNPYGAGLNSHEQGLLSQIKAGQWPYGKHVGSKIVDAPVFYILWWANKRIFDNDKLSTKALVGACEDLAVSKGWFEIQALQEKGLQVLRTLRINRSGYIGEVGKHQRFNLRLEFLKSFETDYGISYVQKFEDKDGNTVVYFGSSELGRVGDQVQFDAKVKEHSDYLGSKQTIVQRPTKVAILQTVRQEAM